MATFSTSQIPASVNTWEKLIWLAYQALRSVVGNREVVIPQQDGSVINRRVCENIDFIDNSGQRRVAVTVYLPVPLDYESTTGKLHTKVTEIVQSTVGATYTTD